MKTLRQPPETIFTGALPRNAARSRALVEKVNAWAELRGRPTIDRGTLFSELSLLVGRGDQSPCIHVDEILGQRTGQDGVYF
ncbi:hypothetical protein NPIL_543691 [Nephila pilipes]|uniref:Uncharacterized protein n=1 Tax=Nephila pilipes TaxID=299642 RepID=A0A8X6NKK7_NEPPI|nr:hypothetical protein NPIL_543691 [Nephila pilipes]